MKLKENESYKECIMKSIVLKKAPYAPNMVNLGIRKKDLINLTLSNGMFVIEFI